MVFRNDSSSQQSQLPTAHPSPFVLPYPCPASLPAGGVHLPHVRSRANPRSFVVVMDEFHSSSSSSPPVPRLPCVFCRHIMCLRSRLLSHFSVACTCGVVVIRLRLFVETGDGDTNHDAFHRHHPTAVPSAYRVLIALLTSKVAHHTPSYMRISKL